MPVIEFLKFHADQARIAEAVKTEPRVVIRAGRRYGKTALLETAGCSWALQGQKVGWFTPDWKRLRPSYTRMHRYLNPAITRASKVESLIELVSGGSVEFWSLADEDAGRSRDYDRVVIDEVSLVAKGMRDIWEQAIAPTLLDRRGSSVMAGTPKGIDPENFFYEACTNKALGWVEMHAPTRLNPTLDPVGVANLATEYPPLVYQQEFLAEFVDWSGSAFFSQDSLLFLGAPLETPRACDAVFAIIDSATKTGAKHDGTAVVYCAIDRIGLHKLQILDWDITQIEGSMLETWLPNVFTNLELYARECGARFGSLGAHIEDKDSGQILLQQASKKGWPAHRIASGLTAKGKDERALNASGPVFRGDVKITRPAFEKITNFKGISRNHFISQVCGFRMGVDNEKDDLLDGFTYSVAFALGNQEGY